MADPVVALAALAALAEALAALPPDADDADLLQALGPVVTPALGDVCLLHTADSMGQLRLAGIFPASTPLVQRLTAELDRQAALMVIYEPLVEEAAPILVSVDAEATPEAVEHQTFLQSAGLAWELVLPLHAGADNDALLVVARAANADPAGPAETSVAAVLGALVNGWRTTRELRRQDDLLRTQLEASSLAGRELAHTLNNSLTMPVGAVELLLDRNTLPADLKEMVEAAATDLAMLERHVRTFQEQMRANAGPRPRSHAPLPPP